MIERLVEVGRHCEMEMNWEKTKVMKISRQLSQVQIMIDQNWGKWNLVSMVTNDARCTLEIKSRVVMEKAAFDKKKALFTSKFDLNLRKKLVKCCIWSKKLDGVENYTLRKLGQKYLESSEVCRSRRTDEISWTDRVRQEEVLR
jgi:hypothetical protein